MCSVSLCHTREFTSARWSGSSPLQNYGFTSHSGRGICLEVQIWYLLAGMTRRLVSRIALRVQITRLWSLLPNMRLELGTQESHFSEFISEARESFTAPELFCDFVLIFPIFLIWSFEELGRVLKYSLDRISPDLLWFPKGWLWGWRKPLFPLSFL